MPRFPSDRTLLACPHLPEEEQKAFEKFAEEMDMPEDNAEDNPEHLPRTELLKRRFKDILKKVKALLEDEEALEEIWQKFPKKGDLPEDHEEDPEEYEENRKQRIEEYEENRRLRIRELLRRAEVDEDLYYRALQHSPKGYVVVQKRDLDEIMVNSYNAEWIDVWDGNMDITFCTDFFGIITYMTEYFVKDETKTMEAIKAALRNCPSEDTKERMKVIANAFMKTRQVGESEACFKLLQELLLKNSNVSCIWVTLEDPATKMQRMKRVMIEGATEENKKYKKIDGVEGLWMEQPDIVSKWFRREPVSEEELMDGKYAHPGDISLAQFAKMYVPANAREPKYREGETKPRDDQNIQNDDIFPEEDQDVREDVDEEDPDAKFKMLMCAGNDHGLELPPYIKIRDPMTGELQYMRRRQYPAVLRFRKNKKESEASAFFLQELMLYDAEVSENVFALSPAELADLYNRRQHVITAVKAQVMEYLEDVELARHFVEDVNRKLDLEETAAETNPENVQEDEELGEPEGHPSYQHLNPGEEEPEKRSSIYKTIDVPNPSELKERTLSLDKYQRKVVNRVVTFTKDIKKNQIQGIKAPSPFYLMVHGGAGSGKTTVIRTLCDWVALILMESGIDTGLPFIIKCAPTGAAASIIEGMTLHTAFNLDYKGKFFSLPDILRDRRRLELRNLILIIIDEVSMMKVEQLYQIDLRLQEIKQRPSVPFGGVSIILLGDMLQLPPVFGHYLFQQPTSEGFRVVHSLDSRWEMFDVINLEINHRQGGCKGYADLLNRMRTNTHTEEDMAELEKRIFKTHPFKHPIYKDVETYIVCTKLAAKDINEDFYAKEKGEEFVSKAIHSQANQKNYVPVIDKVGQVAKTGFMDELKLKVGSKVMLNHNIDVEDCLTNGQMGTFAGTIKAANGQIKMIIVNFKNGSAGKIWRKNHPNIGVKYPRGVGLEKLNWAYSLKEHSQENLAVVQYPLILAYAVTAHKIQVNIMYF